jgi:ABC-type nitrate/sulfonate/bicarbonate transport system substrate-binding protein
MDGTMNIGASRRTALKLGIGALSAGGMLLVDPRAVLAAPDPSLGIPQVSVRWGALPFPNHCWTVLAGRKGFLADVGITMTGGAAADSPRIVNEKQVIPELQNHELDVSGHYFGGIIQALDKLPDARPFWCYAYFQGRTVLVPKDSHYKTVGELLSQGVNWADATKQAIGQMKGKRLGLLNEPSATPFVEFVLAQGGLTLQDVVTIPVENPKIVQLALASQLDFASPNGAAQIYQLQYQAGWKPLIDMPLMIKSMPNGPAALSDFLNYDLQMCMSDYLEKNRDTVFRVCGALYRTLEYMFGPDQKQALTEYAPFINATVGAQLDATSLKFIFEELDPFFRWERQEEIWTKADSPLYYRNIFEPQIARLIKSGALPDQKYDLDKIFAAKGIWEEMRAMKATTESLLAKGSGGLDGKQKAQFDAARQHHAWYNFLDSSRLAKAALG